MITPVVIAFAAFFSTTSGFLVPELVFDARVVGGEDAPVGYAPHQVSLRSGFYNSHFCGGSVLNERWVLTAGHCLESQLARSIKVIVGTNHLNSGGDTYAAEKLIVHEDYDSNRIKNDVALLKVKTPIHFTDLVKPISIFNGELAPGSDLQLTGWGRLSYPGVLPNNLQLLNVKSVDVGSCKQLLNSINPVFDNQVCAFSKKEQGACHGDSGGPLVYNNELVGVVSWGVPCAKGYPDVYSSASAFQNWIQPLISQGLTYDDE